MWIYISENKIKKKMNGSGNKLWGVIEKITCFHHGVKKGVFLTHIQTEKKKRKARWRKMLKKTLCFVKIKPEEKKKGEEK